VTLDDIAARCGVHRMTVSRALRGFPHISAKTRASILQAASELGYDPSQHEGARRLALRRHAKDVLNRVIALCIPYNNGNILNSYFNVLYDGILTVLLAEEYSALMISANVTHTTRDALPLPFHRGDVDALIGMMAPYVFYPLQTKLRDLPTFDNRPILSLMEKVRGCSSVCADDQRGAYDAASHLLALGHRHLLLFVDPEQRQVENSRQSGVSQALCEFDLNPAQYLHVYTLPHIPGTWLDPDMTAFTTADGEVPPAEADARHALATYLQAHPEITALVAQNDTNARHAWYVLNALNLRVPEDMSLIGFDDTDPITDEHGRNILTSVRIPLRQIGQAAGRCIIRHVENPELPEEDLVLPVELIIRASTAPPRAMSGE